MAYQPTSALTWVGVSPARCAVSRKPAIASVCHVIPSGKAGSVISYLSAESGAPSLRWNAARSSGVASALGTRTMSPSPTVLRSST